MKTAVILLCGLFCITSLRLTHRRIFSITGLFVLMWTVCMGFSSLGFFEMNTPSWDVVILGCASEIIYLFAALLPYKKRVRLFPQSMTRINTKALTDNNILILCNILSYIISIPFLVKISAIYLVAGAYDVRDMAFGTQGVFTSTAILMFYQYIVKPIYTMTIILTIMDLSERKVRKIAILISVLDVVIYTYLFAGRYMVFETLLIFLFVFYDKSKFRSIIKFVFKRKKVAFLGAALIVALIWVSISRSDTAFVKSLYTYFCGSFSYLSYLIDNEIGTNLYLLGTATFGFIYNTISVFMTFIMGTDYFGSDNIITQLTQYMVGIGGGIKYNSLGTMLHDFMADFGVYGCLFGVLIFATVSNYIEKMSYRDVSNPFLKALRYYFLYITINTVFAYSFRGPAAFFLLFFLYYFTRGKILVSEVDRNAF